MPTDLLGRELDGAEARLLELYLGLRELLAVGELPPTAAAGVRQAIAQLAQPLTSLGLTYEPLDL